MTVQCLGAATGNGDVCRCVVGRAAIACAHGAAALWQTNQSVQLNSDVRQSLEQRASLRLLMRGMQDADGSALLLTGDESHLEPYLAGREDAERELSNIDRVAPSDAAWQAHRLRELVAAKLDEAGHHRSSPQWTRQRCA
ncbi:MAG: CHASE3 domain-containing protein [Caulobacteraceae bacterium]|nr:CHASE3 domain-containing protein [Caulobacteraceae bacterium]